MPHYVEVPAQDIEDFLSSKGFERTVHCQEVVYVRAHDRDPDVKVKVYTSIRTGAQSTRARGADSIKVCTVFDNGRKSFGIGRFPRVHRTGSAGKVLKRTYQRMREAYARGSEWLREQEARRTEDLAWKAESARAEREREAEAFMSDPDMAGFVRDPDLADVPL